MNELHPTQTVEAPAEEAAAEEAAAPEPLIEADDLIEEVSIDGMCGVY
ncbi:mycofactocin precursor MftA [Streptomyces malaysiensis]|uniref:Mycofactocin MftA n=1 Tax=Streptomyces malaysiensis subsp. samsunensis TaxID=459658 RepID=A0A9X2M5L5_STRMQ|nr:mycofactocin precursor MftA [Streptomyces samsunensis]MCQ8835210.1 mycofactocin precursor MftA [Streptomyces samsunensis]